MNKLKNFISNNKDEAGALMSLLGNIGGPALSGGLNSKAGNIISGIGNTAGGILSTINPIVGGAVSAASGILGGLTNSLFGADLNDEVINSIEANNEYLNNLNIDTTSNDSILNQWNSTNFGYNFNKSDLGKEGLFSNKVTNLYNDLSDKQKEARKSALNAFSNAINTSNTQTSLNLLSNYKSKGGFLNTKEGLFSNGIVQINNGGTHEENPNEGIQLGVDQQGIPNLVEEGEVLYNDYVFSNRLIVPKQMRDKYRLRKNKDITFAEAAKKLQKESEERPNDPISKRGLESFMTNLAILQEDVRAKENSGKKNKSNKYAEGGLPDFLVPNKDSFIIPEGQYGFTNDYRPTINMAPVGDVIQGNNPSARYSTPINTTPDYSKTANKNKLSLLRYAPVLGSAIGTATDLLGITNKPDYSNSNLIGDYIDKIEDVSYTPISNYLTYKPLDRDYYINKLNSVAGANRRAIENQSGSNRGLAIAGLLASDNNMLGKLGDLARQSEEYNQSLRERVESFNRGTNQFNSEMQLKSDLSNQANSKFKLQALMQEAQMRDQIDSRANAARMANLTNLFDSLGDIGREEFSRNMISSNGALYYDSDRLGYMRYKTPKDKENKKSKGGFLTIKRRK